MIAATNPANGGAWLWGSVLVILASMLLYHVFRGKEATRTRIENSATVLAAIVAACALAWSHFFKAGESDAIKEIKIVQTQLNDLTTEVRQLREQNQSSANGNTDVDSPANK